VPVSHPSQDWPGAMHANILDDIVKQSIKLKLNNNFFIKITSIKLLGLISGPLTFIDSVW
jgi:hypothetical protein